MGCMQKVFATEIDVELFRAGRAHPRGLRHRAAGRLPLARCAFEVERAREGAEEPCVNPSFFDWPDAGRDAIRAFDLRDQLDESFASEVFASRSRA